MASTVSPVVEPTPSLTRLAPDVYAYLQPDGGWCVSNAGVLLGPDAVTLVDATATERRARLLAEHIASLTWAPVRTLVVTHRHGDHHYGARTVAPDAVVVAHENARADIIGDGLNLPGIWPDVTWGEVAPAVPTLTYTDRLTLHAGELRVELWHPGPAHTTGDTVVWIPEHRVLFTGDITFSEVTPLCMMGSIEGSLEVLSRLAALDPAVVVSGHGPLAGPEVFAANADYLRLVQELATEGIAAGLTPLEAARRADLGRFKTWLDPERLVANLHRAYAEAHGVPRGAELDNYAILADVAAFNGGRIPACLA
ncbi:MBL fold metallo-hydrolase [Catellatospora methionotrophica]|uniref:MBL fold metallo-hydrolase n=1 Tax=Catellatospora methionotrophica TaxID=121620 RepID=UPI0033C90525